MAFGLLSIGLNTNAQRVDYSHNKTFINPTPGEITIMAWNPIPDGVEATRQSFVDLVECGFNLGTEPATADVYKKLFAKIGDLDFKYLVSNPELQDKKVSKWVKKFRKSKYVAGWNFQDKPLYDRLDELKLKYDALYALDPRRLIYMNLVGQEIKDYTGSTKDLAEYVNVIEQKFQPPVWSYEYDPIVLKDGKQIVDHNQFYYDLEVFSDISRKTNRPFWSYCLSMAFDDGEQTHPMPTESTMRFEVFSALAYGAQGIVYWTYGQRANTDKETYETALVDLNGNKTEAWSFARKINSEVKRFNEIFYGCRVKDVRHVGSKYFKGTKRLNGEIGPFASIDAGNSGVMISLLENNNKRYVIVVSRDVLYDQKVALRLSGGKSVKLYTPEGEKQFSPGSEFTTVLPKGSYFIFEEI